MLHQMEFKLQVEMQYKQGIDKMAKLYQADGDKKSRADAESKRVESEKKIQLLQSALKRYKNLHVLDDVAEDEDPGPLSGKTSGNPDNLFYLDGTQGDRKDNLRAKPLSGTLYVTVKGARELEHAPMPTFSRLRSSSKQITETQISIKVEGTQAARTHPSRTDRWNEDFEITVDKANEVEITVYDKQGSDPNPIPIGMVWIRISDLVEALRRQKVVMESSGGWVTAGAMSGDSPTMSAHGMGGPNMGMDTSLGSAPMPGGPPRSTTGPQSDGIDAWFAVEPAGAIALHLNFSKSCPTIRMGGN